MTVYAFIEILSSDIPNEPGVYCIENIETKRIYIGSSINQHNRIRRHLSLLFCNTHGNQHLQRVFNKHGVDSFLFYSLENTKEEDRIEVEQKYLDVFLEAQSFINGINRRFDELGYNMCPTAGSMDGYQWTDEQIIEQSRISKRFWKDIEYRDKQMAIKACSEFKEKMSIINKETSTPRKKPVLVYNRFTGEFEKEFESVRDAARQLGYKRTLIMDVLHDKRRFTHDKIFKFKIGSIYSLKVEPILDYHIDRENIVKTIHNRAKKQQTPILAYDLSGKQVGEYEGITKASESLGISTGGIKHVLHGRSTASRGYTFRYKDPNYKPKKYNKSVATIN